ncbi:MAG: hypothetical protein BV457_01640 [Thermoplasmata archaeon M9B1D]|nr:MAG: hypothetical protein BV457_01640 [Thermoplasmata archaeon M9B1D]
MVEAYKAEAEVFVEHIKKHLKDMGLKDVCCKICGKTIKEIYDIESKSGKNLFIESGIYESGKVYYDMNHKRFAIHKMGDLK